MCKQGDAEEAALTKEEERINHEHLGTAREAEDLAPFYEKAAALDRRFDARIRALPKPPGEAANIAKIEAGHEDQAAAAERIANGLRHYEATAFEALAKETKEEHERLVDLEQGYGFKICGSGGGASSSSSESRAGTTGSGSNSAAADLRIGQAGAVGNLSIRPTSFVNLGGSGEATKWRATITVKNDGSEPVQPFCGSGQASLTDAQGRVYEGEAAVNEANSVNCGEKVQPGLSGSPFVVDFKTPTAAKPKTLSLWGESEYQEQAKTWSVP